MSKKLVINTENMHHFEQDGKIWDIDKLPDNFVIKGDVNFSNSNLEKLPDLSKVKVDGNFNCSKSNILSLKGAPQEVRGDFDCSDCVADSNSKYEGGICSLSGAPKKIGGNFNCSGNDLESLSGGPQEVGGDYNCSANWLHSLKGAPKNITGNFNCSENIELKSLKGAPEIVGGTFNCSNSELLSLKNAPKVVYGDLVCDKKLSQERANLQSLYAQIKSGENNNSVDLTQAINKLNQKAKIAADKMENSISANDLSNSKSNKNMVLYAYSVQNGR